MKSERHSKKKSLARRAHAFGACKTCRKRHVRCDQARPICKACKESDLDCEDLGSEIHWVGSSATDSDRMTAEASSGPNVRRHLYTEKERQTMSTALVDQLASFPVDHYLLELDNTLRLGDLDDQKTSEISMGPFGVLNLAADTSRNNEGTDEILDDHNPLEGDVANGTVGFSSNSLAQLSTAEEMLGNLDTYLQWSDIFNLDPPLAGWTLTPPASGFEDQAANITPPNSTEFSFLQPGFDDLQAVLSQNQTESPDILAEGPLLLRHFSEHVVTKIIWLPMTRKSPWTILNIPHAMVTLDQITYMKQKAPEHASIANLYGIFACAAFHLSTSPSLVPDTGRPDQYWHQLAVSAYAEGKSQLSRSLELELEGPQKAKYKEQLMAMLSLTTFAIISNNQRESRCHLINMEYLILLRGLVKPKVSRRARLLHYTYTWMRILTESTLVLHHEISHTAPSKSLWSRRLDMEELTRLNKRRADVSEQNRGLDDFLRISTNESDTYLNIDDPKDVQANLGDIHLVDSRKHEEELHSVVNGVSETWLGLLSQTTRLANVLDQINSGSCKVTAERQLALQRRSLHLENMICIFTSRKLPISCGDPKGHMLKALNFALVIFFYRRVRRVNPCILQGHVKDVIRELQGWDAALERHSLVGPGSAWPAFVAGCEATASKDRHEIFDWLRKANLESGFSSYCSAAGIMEEVWKIRDGYCGAGNSPLAGSQPCPTAFSWPDYSKENLQWLLLF